MNASSDSSASPGIFRRGVKSFVLRAGRVGPGQQRALEQLGPKFCVSYAPQPLDTTVLFGKKAPVILEIGFGMGETTAAIAAAHPQFHYLGV